jgi:hypothetical protein
LIPFQNGGFISWHVSLPRLMIMHTLSWLLTNSLNGSRPFLLFQQWHHHCSLHVQSHRCMVKCT